MGTKVVAEYSEEGIAILSDSSGKFMITRESDNMIHIPELKDASEPKKFRVMSKLPFSLYIPHREVSSMMQ